MSPTESITAATGAALRAETRASVRARRSFSYHRNATFFALLIGYMGYYLCRQNFSEAYAPMKTALGMDKTTFGSIASFGTLVYAIGKFTTGALADGRGGRFTFLLGMAGSVAASLLFGISTGVVFFFVFWAINRYFQSMGWASLTTTVARWYAPREYGTAMGVMSISYQFGGVVASVFAGTLLAIGMGWRGLFLVPAATLALLGFALRPFLVSAPRDIGFAAPGDDTHPEAMGEAASSPGPAGPHLTYSQRFRTILANPMFLVMCGLSLILTFIRECFTLWMPAYFSDMGATASMSAFKSSVFPLLGCAGTLFAGWYSDRYLKAKRGPILTVFLIGLALTLVGLGYAGEISAFAQAHVSAALNRNVVSLSLVGIAGFLLFGPYSMIGGGVVALDFGGRETAGTAAGLLDGAGYFAATAAGLGVGTLVTRAGWSFAFVGMAALTAVSVGLCAVVWVRQRR